MKNRGAAGARRERDEVRHWQQRGYIAFRSPASLGVADVIAMKAYGVHDDDPPAVREWLQVPPVAEVVLVECKANVGSPYMNFRAVDRAELRLAARLAGATALLVHHPPRGERREYPESDWPEARGDVAA